MLAASPLLLALVGTAPAVAQPAEPTPAVLQQRATAFAALVGASCLAPPDLRKALLAGKKSVALVQPNVTVLPTFGADPPPADPCPSGFVAEITVASTSTPPAGYGKTFDISGTIDGRYLFDAFCDDLAASVGIYEVDGGRLVWKGGGGLVTSWDATVNPKLCEVAPAPDFVGVHGKVPASGTKTFRVIVHTSAGSAIVKATRRKS